MTRLPTPAQLEAAGLYDRAAPDADERLELITMALERGATYDEIRRAITEHRLHAVAAERVIVGGNERLTLDAAIARSGIDPAFGLRVWRALGFVVPGADEPVCTEADIELFRFFEMATGLFTVESTVALARTTGNAMARHADAAISGVRAMLEAPMRSEGGTSVDVARAFTDVAEDVVPQLYPMLETVHRHHLLETARRYSLWGVAPTAESTTEAVVGFADVVGYTALSQRLSPVEIDSLVVGFEERALTVIARPGARLVKVIGDEVMFVAGDVADAIDIARCLVADDELPDLRVGLAAGEVVSVEGDLFGPVVNLAARLVQLAAPGGILLDAETARRLGSAPTLRSEGERAVAGFAEPVEVFSIDAASTPESA
jgi:adenylate cyclase